MPGEQVIKGIAEGCVRAGCALIGGETAELPGFYARGEYDLAGFCVGVVEKSKILDGSRVRAGDAVIGMASSGLHSNGFSLARKVFENDLGAPLARELLEPTRIYVKDCLALRDALEVRAFAHITGGGLPGNLPRVLPASHRAVLRRGSWPVPAIFERIRKAGNVAEAEMLHTFNMGIGMCAVVARADVPRALDLLSKRGQPAFEISTIESAPGLAEPRWWSRGCPRRDTAASRGAGLGSGLQPPVHPRRLRRQGPSPPGRGGDLQRARRPRAASRSGGRSLCSFVIAASRAGRLRQGLVAALRKRDVDLVCLAGFMRLIDLPS
jgi:hypothetical protein